jgi:hypothetical protein
MDRRLRADTQAHRGGADAVAARRCRHRRPGRREPQNAAALARAGIDYSLLEFPGAGHGFDVSDTDEIFTPVLKFLDDRLG